MSVYVDNMRMQASVPNGVHMVNGRWSHMFADSTQELDEFALKLDLNPSWKQNSRGFIHYDLVESRRKQAVLLGAIEIEYRELPDYIARIFPNAPMSRSRLRKDILTDAKC